VVCRGRIAMVAPSIARGTCSRAGKAWLEAYCSPRAHGGSAPRAGGGIGRRNHILESPLRACGDRPRPGARAPAARAWNCRRELPGQPLVRTGDNSERRRETLPGVHRFLAGLPGDARSGGAQASPQAAARSGAMAGFARDLQLGLEPKVDWAAGMRQMWRPGERGASQAMKAFLGRAIESYPTDRDRPDRGGTSRLSPHLHFGEISARRIWHRSAPPSRGRRSLSEANRLARVFLSPALPLPTYAAAGSAAGVPPLPLADRCGGAASMDARKDRLSTGRRRHA
jgi:hypothetical protein